MAIPKIHFPPHEGLPDLSNPALWGLPPTVDGFIEPDLGVSTDRAGDETGWKRSQRLTYQSGGAVPNVVFQGLKHAGQDFIYLGFLVRFDSYFDDEDVIVLLLRPSYAPVPADAAHTLDTVRIDIYPVHEGTGAGPAGALPVEPTYQTRTNHPPAQIVFRKWTAAGWSAPYAVPNVEVKCRSWDTGIGQHNKCWSVELKLPTKIDGASGGGPGWMNLPPAASFGIYFNVVRVCGADLCQDLPVGFPTDVYAAFQYTWPRKVDLEAAGLGTGVIRSTPGATGTYLEAHPLDARWLGEASLSSAGARGVSFVGIGMNPASPGGPLGYTIDGALGTNTFVARVKNDGEADAENVTATFRLANWGIGPGTVDKWAPVGTPVDPLGAVGPNPTSPTTLGGTPAMGTAAPVDLTLAWTMGPSERVRYAPPHDHQCVWVVLDSVSDVNFVEGSRHTNLDFVNLSEHESEVEISGVGHPAPNASGEHVILLRVSPRLLESASYIDPKDLAALGELDPEKRRALRGRLPAGEPTGLQDEIFRRWDDSGALGKMPVGTLVWIVNAYRTTDEVVRIGQKVFRNYEPISTFTYAAQHVGDVVAWRGALSGDNRLTTVSQDTYVVRVPDGDSVRLRVHLEAVAPEDESILDRILRLIDEIQAVLVRLRSCAERLDDIRALLRKLVRLARGSSVLKPLAAGLADLLTRCEHMRDQLAHLARFAERIEAIEHAVAELDRQLDKLRAVDGKRREQIARKLYGNDADHVLKQLARFEKHIQKLGDALLLVLVRILGWLEDLAAFCSRAGGLHVALRALLRLAEKIRIVRVPVDSIERSIGKILGGSLQKPLPGATDRDTLAEYVLLCAEALALCERLTRALGGLDEMQRALEDLDDEKLSAIIDEIHEAAAH